MDLCKRITKWMVANSMEKAMKSGTQATINQVKPHNKGKGGKTGKGGSGGSGSEKPVTKGVPPEHIKNTPVSLNGKCICCGASSHVKDDCPVDKGTLQCKKCNRKGHLEKVCLQDYNKWRFPGSAQGKAGHKPPARVRKVSASSAEDDEEDNSQ